MAQRILLIDDDEGYLLATRRLLEGAGYEVSAAANTAEARKQLQSAKPDLILLDVIMPGEDGFTFAQELSDSKVIAGVPVILVTAVGDSQGQMMSAFENDKGLTTVDVLPKSQVHKCLLECVASALRHGKDAPAQEPNA